MNFRKALFLVTFLLWPVPLLTAQSRLPDTGQTGDFTAAFGEDADYTINPPSYTVIGDATVTDAVTGLVWQQVDGGEMTFAQAVTYADSLSLAGWTDWRLPVAHELFAILDHGMSKPEMALIPAGEFEMGDHFGFVDPSHPSDEVPIHTVRVDSFTLAKTLTTNDQYIAFLNDAMRDGLIEVRDAVVYRKGDSSAYCFTNQRAAYYSIAFDGSTFSMADFRTDHPVIGVLWCGAAAYCNWLSAQEGDAPCYDLSDWTCDFTRNGYRLPTEAEWEWAGRGGHIAPYQNYVFGNSIDATRANLPDSGDPYETGPLPNTTPVGFYNGSLRKKSDFNWPGAAATYQTSDGANAFGLYDMQGNVWEFVNDWYGQDYYRVSPYDNPTGPDRGSMMPDGKPYRGVRGGNWFNGLTVDGVNDGHSRVSNRNPSYYRGPGGADAPWHHTGFRIARRFDGTSTGFGGAALSVPSRVQLFQNYPNPFTGTTTLRFSLSEAEAVTLLVHDILGRVRGTRALGRLASGMHEISFDGSTLDTGVYYLRILAGSHVSVISVFHMHK